MPPCSKAPAVPGISGNFMENSEEFRENFREIPGKFPGIFREFPDPGISGKVSGNFKEFAGISSNFREFSGNSKNFKEFQGTIPGIPGISGNDSENFRE